MQRIEEGVLSIIVKSQSKIVIKIKTILERWVARSSYLWTANVSEKEIELNKLFWTVDIFA